MMMVYRIGLFAVAIFGFVTLYDCGPANFLADASTELTTFAAWLRALTGQ